MPLIVDWDIGDDDGHHRRSCAYQFSVAPALLEINRETHSRKQAFNCKRMPR